MSRRTRLVLALIGLVLVILSLAALAYAVPPPARQREQIPVAPTFLTVPVEQGV